MKSSNIKNTDDNSSINRVAAALLNSNSKRYDMRKQSIEHRNFTEGISSAKQNSDLKNLFGHKGRDSSVSLKMDNKSLATLEQTAHQQF